MNRLKTTGKSNNEYLGKKKLFEQKKTIKTKKMKY